MLMSDPGLGIIGGVLIAEAGYCRSAAGMLLGCVSSVPSKPPASQGKKRGIGIMSTHLSRGIGIMSTHLSRYHVDASVDASRRICRRISTHLRPTGLLDRWVFRHGGISQVSKAALYLCRRLQINSSRPQAR